MVEIDPTDRRALGILSETVNEQLGPSDVVAREVHRAFTSGKEIDRVRAGSVFNDLPGWQRNMIGFATNDRARDVVRLRLGSTGRDWCDFASPMRSRERSGARISPPPRFLLNRDR
ncbi:MAG: hypothetical protein OSB69_11850 [Alphaproteobacteria bacterium]|nr:hypothetical protein [Alphaproteobacteria bacterium]